MLACIGAIAARFPSRYADQRKMKVIANLPARDWAHRPESRDEK